MGPSGACRRRSATCTVRASVPPARRLSSSSAISLSIAASSELDIYAPVAPYMTPSKISAEQPNSPAYSKVRRKLEVRRISGSAADTISCPSDRMDQLRFVALVDLGAQPTDVGFDNVRPGVEMNFPDVLEQHRAGDDLASVPHQVFEQSEFPWLQLDQLPAPSHRASQ